MMRLRGIAPAACGLLAGLLASGCGAEAGSDSPGEVRLTVAGSLGVAGLSGVLAQVTCDDGTMLERYAPLEAEGLPAHVDPALVGSTFADVFAVLPAGLCDVTVWAMLDPETPAEACEAATATIEVMAGLTVEAVLPIVCSGTTGGAGDVTVVIDNAPVVEKLVIAPGTTVPACTTVAIRVDASDADGDPLTYAFEVTSKVVGAEFEAVSDGDVLLLTAKTAGGYAIKVTVSDGLATTAATTAVFVEEAPCP